ncbi:uncharacterized protein PGTG_11955 [Puccinia graminis f. sp. tritici CRL 75-36-700-3]|uniref:Uncharacterized protein n=1 Tax=Puccinia graminis f. sp. tritici (strain CRL 75-36-700-3 / race SCCL) TaxID=418459 RepID=E3KMS4_PUCGT|nr:uncharacterized protein PGTG_11955 [Puccinia graminis f. sp. tritici CRL 75-36-700-3]EFP85599.1 hypothetical protein PGTG_11955 [Puccinia graminis f. sp. tritici CRL 75-36-700-3]
MAMIHQFNLVIKKNPTSWCTYQLAGRNPSRRAGVHTSLLGGVAGFQTSSSEGLPSDELIPPVFDWRASPSTPPGGAGSLARPSEVCFLGKSEFQGVCNQTRPSEMGGCDHTPLLEGRRRAGRGGECNYKCTDGKAIILSVGGNFHGQTLGVMGMSPPSQKAVQSHGWEGFLPALRLYMAQGQEGFLSALSHVQSQGEEVCLVGLETIPSWRRGCTTSSTRRRECWPARLYNLAARRIWLKRLYNLAGQEDSLLVATSPARRIPSWSTRLYSLAGQDILLLVDKVVQPYNLAGQEDSLLVDEVVQSWRPGFPPGRRGSWPARLYNLFDQEDSLLAGKDLQANQTSSRLADLHNIKQALNAHRKNTTTVLLEPIQGKAGIIVPDNDYIPKVKALCESKNVLLIMDEVQTGLGQTGKLGA